MNTLADLNNWSQGLIYFDDQNRTYTVSFNSASDVAAVSAAEDSEVLISATWDGTFSEIQAIDNTGDGVKIQVDLTNFAVNGRVDWGTLPTGVTINESVANVFEAKNIYKIVDYNTLIAQVKITLIDVEANTTYAIKTLYPSTANPAVYTTDTQTVSLTITSTSDEMTTPSQAATYQEDDTLVATTLPTIVDTSPADTTYNFEISPSNIAVIDSYNYTAPPGGSGTTVSFNSGQRKLTIDGTKTNVQNVIDSITLDPTANSDVSYVFNYSLTNNTSAKVTSSSAAVTVTALAEIDNIGITRAYTENQITTNLFPTSAPTISSALSDPSYTVRFDITTYNNATSQGYLKDNSTSDAAAKFITFTGTKTQVDTWMSSNVRYIPPPNLSSQQQIKVTLNSATQINDISYFYVDGTADATPIPGTGTTSYTTDTVVTFTEQQKYFLKCDVLAVASGGAGGTAAAPNYAGGGGGAGAVFLGTDVDLILIATTDVKIQPGGGGTNNNSIIKSNTNSDVYITCLQGGAGANAPSNNGNAGGSGGGASGGSSGRTGGAGTTPVYTLTGTITTQAQAGDGNTTGTLNGANGGGSGVASTILGGSSVTYAEGGFGGLGLYTNFPPNTPVVGDIPTPKTSIGSGGSGQSMEYNDGATYGPGTGVNGVIILKLYTY